MDDADLPWSQITTQAQASRNKELKRPLYLPAAVVFFRVWQQEYRKWLLPGCGNFWQN